MVGCSSYAALDDAKRAPVPTGFLYEDWESSRHELCRRLPRFEPHRRMRPAQLDQRPRDAQPVAFGQSDHGQAGIYARELGEALVARLPMMAGERDVDVVRIDLEGN